MLEEKKEERPEHLLVWILFVLISLIFRIFFGSLFFPIPFVISGMIGGTVLFIGSLIWWKWTKLWRDRDGEQLVTRGLYEHVRHPHYLSIIVISLGIVFLMQSLVFLVFTLLTGIGLNRGAKKEEKHLIKLHGDDYKEYMEKVQYRFVPRII